MQHLSQQGHFPIKPNALQRQLSEYTLSTHDYSATKYKTLETVSYITIIAEIITNGPFCTEHRCFI